MKRCFITILKMIIGLIIFTASYYLGYNKGYGNCQNENWDEMQHLIRDIYEKGWNDARNF